MQLSKFFRDLYTGPDQKTWALGRIYSIPILATGVAAPIIAIIHSKVTPIPLGDVGLELGGVAAAVGAMVAVTNHIDARTSLLPSQEPAQ